MKKLLFSLIVLGLMSPFAADAAPRKKGRGGKGASRVASRQRQDKNSVDNCFRKYKEFMGEGNEAAALKRLANVIVPAAQEVYRKAPQLPGHKESAAEYVCSILKQIDSAMFEKLNRLALSFPDFDNKEQEVIVAANNILGSLMLLTNYVSNDDKEMQRLSLAQQHLAKAITYQSDPAMESLLDGVENQLGQRAADSGDIETAKFYWESAAVNGNAQAKQSIYKMQLAQLRDEGQRFSRHIAPKLDMPFNKIEEYDRKAREEGDVESFELMSRYYLEQCKRGIEAERNITRFLDLFRETVDRWLASERDWQADLERTLPTLREMCSLNKRCEHLLIAGLTVLGGRYERQRNYLKAAEFYQGLLEISPTHRRVLNFANFYFEGLLNLKGKASWQKGIEILDSAAQRNSVEAALALAKIYKAGFNFDCGGRLNANAQKAVEYEQLAGRNQGIAASEQIIGALGARPSSPSGDPSLNFLMTGASELARGNIQAGLESLERSYAAGILRSQEGKDAFFVNMLTEGLDENLTKAQNSEDTKTALQALSFRTLFLAEEFKHRTSENEEVAILKRMIVCMKIATQKALSSDKTDGCIDDLIPDICEQAHLRLSSLFISNIPTILRFSPDNQKILQELFDRYQKDLGLAAATAGDNAEAGGKAEA